MRIVEAVIIALLVIAIIGMGYMRAGERRFDDDFCKVQLARCRCP